METAARVCRTVAVLFALGMRPAQGGERPPDRVDFPPTHLTIKQFVLELYQRISDDRVVAISAGVTFFILLAIFPATAATVSIYGLFGGVKSINGDLSSLSSFLPGGAIQILGEQIKALVAKGDKALGLGAIARHRVFHLECKCWHEVDVRCSQYRSESKRDHAGFSG